MREFPVEDRGEINRSKLGWLLKKNANRIINGSEFQKAEADGRTGWRVLAVNSPASPDSPSFGTPPAKTVAKPESPKFANLSTFEVQPPDSDDSENRSTLSDEPPEAAF